MEQACPLMAYSRVVFFVVLIVGALAAPAAVNQTIGYGISIEDCFHLGSIII